MNKTELIEATAAEADISKAAAGRALDAILATVVKAVMNAQVFATAVTWTVWLAKTIELAKARRNARNALRELGNARNVEDAVRQVPEGTVAQLLEGALAELRLSTDRMDKDGIKVRIASRLQQIEAAASRRIAFGTGVLATIGSALFFRLLLFGSNKTDERLFFDKRSDYLVCVTSSNFRTARP